MKYSIVIPVYKNEKSISRLLSTLELINKKLNSQLEVVFVVDGSPDNSFEILSRSLKNINYPVQLLAHSRNFGSFAAIRTGLKVAQGKYCGIMAADLQEPPELIMNIFFSLDADECDVAIATRKNRRDPLLSKLSSKIFWSIYRKLVVTDMPEGGVDIFGCNQVFRQHLLQLEESHSSLIALIFWLGFRRKFIPYDRLERCEGKSSWIFSKKIEYMLDSVFSFTDFPIRLLTLTGAVGSVVATVIGIVVVIGRLTGAIEVPGYAAIMIATLLLGTINLLGLGLVGTYAWRTYENSKRRPLAIVAMHYKNQRSTNEYS